MMRDRFAGSGCSLHPVYRNRWITASLLAFLVCRAAGIAQTGSRSVPSQEPSILDRLQSTQRTEAAIPLGAKVDPESYVVGPSDGLGLNIWMSPPVQYRLDVTPEGTLVIPTVGEFAVAGSTLKDVKERIVSAVKRRYTSPDVTLTLIRPRPIIVTVEGMVLHGGQYTMVATDRPDRAIQLANATLTPAELVPLENVLRRMSRRHIVVKRLDGTRWKADIVRFLATGADADNPYLREGDVVIVPQADPTGNNFAVYGEVNAPGRFEFADGDRLGDALQMAQGFTDQALVDSIEISRLSTDGRTMEERYVAIDRVSLMPADNLLIQPGDRVIVRKRNDLRADYRVYIEGEVKYPGTYPITKDRSRISDVIAQAGGFTEFASLRSAELSRRSIDPEEVTTERLMSFRGGINPDDSLDYLNETELRLKKEIVNVDFERLFTEGDSSQDVFLQTEDVIRIPSVSKTIYVFGQVVTPGHIQFRGGEGPEYYVEKAGGFTDRARRDDLRIIKSRTKQWLAEDETEIEEGDYIWIPREPDRPFSYYMTVASQAASVLSVIIGMAAVVISVSN